MILGISWVYFHKTTCTYTPQIITLNISRTPTYNNPMSPLNHHLPARPILPIILNIPHLSGTHPVHHPVNDIPIATLGAPHMLRISRAPRMHGAPRANILLEL